MQSLEKSVRRLKQMLAMPPEEVELLLRAVTAPGSELFGVQGDLAAGGAPGHPTGVSADHLRALEGALVRARNEILAQGHGHGAALTHLEEALVSMRSQCAAPHGRCACHIRPRPWSRNPCPPLPRTLLSRSSPPSLDRCHRSSRMRPPQSSVASALTNGPLASPPHAARTATPSSLRPSPLPPSTPGMPSSAPSFVPPAGAAAETVRELFREKAAEVVRLQAALAERSAAAEALREERDALRGRLRGEIGEGDAGFVSIQVWAEACRQGLEHSFRAFF